MSIRFNSQTKDKPLVVADYNQYMLGVDKLDQLTSYYSFLHRSVKWWRKVFFWLLEVSVVNSYVIYKEGCEKRGVKQLTHINHCRALVEKLSEVIRINRKDELGVRSYISLERLQPIRHFIKKGIKRRDGCVVCSSRQQGGTRHLTPYFCETCSLQPALCPGECSKIYHIQNHLDKTHIHSLYQLYYIDCIIICKTIK